MQSEKKRIEEMMDEMHEGKNIGNRLVVGGNGRRVRPERPGDDPDDVIAVGPEDMGQFS